MEFQPLSLIQIMEYQEIDVLRIQIVRVMDLHAKIMPAEMRLQSKILPVLKMLIAMLDSTALVPLPPRNVQLFSLQELLVLLLLRQDSIPNVDSCHIASTKFALLCSLNL